MTKIFAILNQKGGVGKTTTTVTLSHALSLKGLKVLSIDLDTQCSFGVSIGINSPLNIFEVMHNRVSVSDATQKTQLGFEFIPSSHTLNDFDNPYTLRDVIEPIQKNYDVILLDCPPNLSSITINALSMAHGVIIPTTPDILSLEGINLLKQTITKVTNSFNSKLKVSGVVVTQFETNRKAMIRCVEILENELFKGKIFKTKIKRNIAIAESPMFKTSVIDYDKNSSGAKLYLELTQEIIDREGLI